MRTPNFENEHFRASKTKEQEQLGTPAQIHFLSFSGLTNFFFFFQKKEMCLNVGCRKSSDLGLLLETYSDCPSVSKFLRQ